MALLEALWQQVVTEHAKAPRYRAKDGVLCMFGCIKASLEATAFSEVWSRKLSAFFTNVVVPEFDAPAEAPFLRSRACWVFAQYADWIDPFEAGIEPMLTVAASKILSVRHITQTCGWGRSACLTPCVAVSAFQFLAPTQPIPVQFTAASSLWFLAQADSEAVAKVSACMSAHVTIA